MANGLLSKTTQVRQQKDTDGVQIQRSLDTLYAPMDGVLAFLNALFANPAQSTTFKSTLAFSQQQTPATAGTAYTAQVPIQGGSATPFLFAAPFSGSIAGVSVSNGSTGTGSVTIQVLKNGQPLLPATLIAPAGTNKSGYTAYKKGQYPFQPGDVLTAQFMFGSGGNYSAQAYLIIEMAA